MGWDVKRNSTIFRYWLKNIQYTFHAQLPYMFKVKIYMFRSVIILVSDGLHAESKPVGLAEQQSWVHTAELNALDWLSFLWIVLLIHSFFKLILGHIFYCHWIQKHRI